MAIPFKDAAKSATHQKAVLESTCGEYLSGTVVYTSGKDLPHSGWLCVFPDGSWRVVDNDNIRLCW